MIYQNIFVDNEGNKYTRVECLESTGTQYIDTGVSGTFNNQIEFIGNFSLNSKSSKEQAILGSKNSSNQGLTIFFPEYSTNLRTWCGSGTAYAINDVALKEKNSLYAIFYKNKGRKIILNNIEYVNDNISNNFTNNSDNFGLFSDKATTLSSPSNIAIHNWKIIKDSVLVRDYVPMLCENNRPCLYDKVSKTYFYNQGTGEFLWG